MGTLHLKFMKELKPPVQAAPTRFTTRRILITALVALALLTSAMFFFYRLYYAKTPSQEKTAQHASAKQKAPPDAPDQLAPHPDAPAAQKQPKIPTIKIDRPKVSNTEIPFKKDELIIIPCPKLPEMAQVFHILYHLQTLQKNPSERKIQLVDSEPIQKLLDTLVTTGEVDLSTVQDHLYTGGENFFGRLLTKIAENLGFSFGEISKSNSEMVFSSRREHLTRVDKYAFLENTQHDVDWKEFEVFRVGETYYKAIALGSPSDLKLHEYFKNLLENRLRFKDDIQRLQKLENQNPYLQGVHNYDLFLRGVDEQSWILCAFEEFTATDIQTEKIKVSPDTIIYKAVSADTIDLEKRQSVPEFRLQIVD